MQTFYLNLSQKTALEILRGEQKHPDLGGLKRDYLSLLLISIYFIMIFLSFDFIFDMGVCPIHALVSFLSIHIWTPFPHFTNNLLRLLIVMSRLKSIPVMGDSRGRSRIFLKRGAWTFARARANPGIWKRVGVFPLAPTLFLAPSCRKS